MSTQARILARAMLAVTAVIIAGTARADEQVYNTACAACHATGVAGAPKLGDKAAWEPRMTQGVDALVMSTLKGKGAMPPKGGNTSLSDAEVKSAVEYMLQKAGLMEAGASAAPAQASAAAPASEPATAIPAQASAAPTEAAGTAMPAPDQRHPSLQPLGPPPVPADNAQTPEKVALGKLLFFDARLSGNGSTSCVTCHLPTAGWGFPTPLSVGYPGTIHWRNSQTIVNSAYYGKLFWAGASRSLEAQAGSAASGAVAGNGESDMMEARLAFIPEYRKRFNEVFGDEWPRVRNAWWAIAAFERTLIQTDTPYDRWLKGDDAALDDAQKRGFELFVGKAACVSCHNGALLSDEQYYNLGVPPAKEWESDGLAQVTFRFELYAKGISEARYRKFKDDPGLYFRTKQVRDLGKFRTPSLRYTKYTAPYMHNGQIQTLKDVVVFYNQGGGKNEFAKTKTSLLKPLGLSDQEIDDLVAFIESMSGAQILMEFPQLPPSAPLGAATE